MQNGSLPKTHKPETRNLDFYQIEGVLKIQVFIGKETDNSSLCKYLKSIFRQFWKYDKFFLGEVKIAKNIFRSEQKGVLFYLCSFFCNVRVDFALNSILS